MCVCVCVCMCVCVCVCVCGKQATEQRVDKGQMSVSKLVALKYLDRELRELTVRDEVPLS